MTSRRTTTISPYSPRQMYELVADIGQYPDFLPWCSALRVVRSNLLDGAGEMHADMIVSYKVFREKFRSKVMLDPANHAIDAHYTDGPFSKLATNWRFAEREDGGADIDFYIEFEFRNPLLQTTAMMVFERAFMKMTDAFVERAHVLYGENGSVGKAAQ